MKQGPLSAAQLQGNLRRFIWFRILFNARFYYPVFTILFLDYGVTLEQFAILNMIWALTVVAAEVPSGALADLLGRKRLLVAAAALMVVEMALLAVVPIGGSALLFWVFLVNRLCSGVAEAAASGADEALAYDSLKALGRESEWAHWLERAGRALSIGFFATMITGALAYDERVVNATLGFLNPGWSLPRETVIRLPVFLTLASACIVLVATLGMHEPPGGAAPAAPAAGAGLWGRLGGPFRQVLQSARWLLDHRFVLFVILAALAIDSVARQFVVLASEYYRIIGIPPAYFGFIGAGLALLGILTARVSRLMVTRLPPFLNYLALSAVLMTGLVGIAFAVPWHGLLFAVCAYVMMGMVGYQSSYYINREVDSARRATVLSFRGLALNLGLALASLLYTALVAALRVSEAADGAEPAQEAVFTASLKGFPPYFLVLFVLVIVLGRVFIRRSRLCFEVRP